VNRLTPWQKLEIDSETRKLHVASEKARQRSPRLGADYVGALAVQALGQGAGLTESPVRSVPACATLAQGDALRRAGGPRGAGGAGGH
jgi:hypothetical protein